MPQYTEIELWGFGAICVGLVLVVVVILIAISRIGRH